MLSLPQLGKFTVAAHDATPPPCAPKKPTKTFIDSSLPSSVEDLLVRRGRPGRRKNRSYGLQNFGHLKFWAYCAEDGRSGSASAAEDACSGIASATADACSGIASATADACSPAAAAACPGTALAAASANCRRLTHSQTATPIAPAAKSTGPTTMDQRRLMLSLPQYGKISVRLRRRGSPARMNGNEV
jgi:hypothetical protein